MSSPNILSKPFAQSSAENKHVILKAIHPFLKDRSAVLEIASGTGQHAVYFAEKMPHLTWQTSDLIDSHMGITQWIADAELPNVLPPLELNVSDDNWPSCQYDALFSANSFHIMAKHHVEDFFKNVSQVLEKKGIVMIYGPFNYQGHFTSESNERFDFWLKQRHHQSGIKDFEWCNQLADHAELTLLKDIEMPQNNRILIWEKK
uniref:Methylase n=1 Tax=Hydrogenovibrio crunogenus (strain DSM 25203 / XCL-2) TaxID=317025 RepID=Q31GV3_HYDCU